MLRYITGVIEDIDSWFYSQKHFFGEKSVSERTFLFKDDLDHDDIQLKTIKS